MHSHVHLLFTLEGSTSTLHTSTLPWSGSKFTMSFPIRYNRSRGDDRVFFITTAAWTAFGKTCITLLLYRFLPLDLFTIRERNRAAKHQSNCFLPFNYMYTAVLSMHSMVTAKQYVRHQAQFPNMEGVIYEISGLVLVQKHVGAILVHVTCAPPCCVQGILPYFASTLACSNPRK